MFITDQYNFSFRGMFLGTVIPSYPAWVRVYTEEGRQAYNDVLKTQIGL